MNPKATQKKSFNVTGIGDMTIKLLTMPLNPEAPKEEHVRASNEEITTMIDKAYPDRKAKGGKSCVAWYASQLNGNDQYRAKHGGQRALPSRGTTAPKTVEIELPKA